MKLRKLFTQYNERAARNWSWKNLFLQTRYHLLHTYQFTGVESHFSLSTADSLEVMGCVEKKRNIHGFVVIIGVQHINTASLQTPRFQISSTTGPLGT